MTQLISIEKIAKRILFIRDEKVMLDLDLAHLYGVKTKRLKRGIRRNIDRFPEDFMFVLTKEEYENLRSHSGISSWGGIRYMPMVFTEQGVAMLSSVLRNKRAIEINVLIMRAFVRLRELLTSNKDLAQRVAILERDVRVQAHTLKQLMEEVSHLLEQPEEPKLKIGLRINDDE